MVYKANGLQIHSENAAKPIAQASRYLLDWIGRYPRVNAMLDYGCGKMRYSIALSRRCNALTLVDSEIQLSRIQIVAGRRCSVRERALKLGNATALAVDAFNVGQQKYDLILCANVLSAIPSWKVRHGIVAKLKASLQPNGECLFITQYRDGYFTKMAAYPNAIKFLDGVLLPGQRGNSFYGLISKPSLEKLLKPHRFVLRRSWIHEKSAYVLAVG